MDVSLAPTALQTIVILLDIFVQLSDTPHLSGKMHEILYPLFRLGITQHLTTGIINFSKHIISQDSKTNR